MGKFLKVLAVGFAAVLGLAAVSVVGLTGCDPVEKITIVEAPMPEFRGLTGIGGEVVVTNRSRRAMVVEDAVATIRFKGREVMTGRLTEPVVVPGRATTRVEYAFGLENVNLSALATLPRIVRSPELVEIDMEATVGWGAVRKKVTLEKVPLLNFITNFAPSRSEPREQYGGR